MFLAAVPAEVKVNWFLIWTKTGWIDIIFLLAVIVGIFVGLRSGLSKVLPRFFAVVTAQVVAVEYAESLAKFLNTRTLIPVLGLHIVMFALLSVGSIFLVGFLLRLAALAVTIDFKPPFNNVGGALVSAFQFVLLLGLIASFLALFPLPFIQETFSGRSFSGASLAQSSEKVHHFFVRELPNIWRKK